MGTTLSFSIWWSSGVKILHASASSSLGEQREFKGEGGRCEERRGGRGKEGGRGEEGGRGKEGGRGEERGRGEEGGRGEERREGKVRRRGGRGEERRGKGE